MDAETIRRGENVRVYAETFSADGVVVERTAHGSQIKVRLNEPRDDLPGDTLWFAREEVERVDGP